MANRNDYMTAAKQIADYLNAFRLAFKTYHVSDFDAQIKAIAGEGARITGDKTSTEFENALMQRGFVIFPALGESQDGYVRVYRADSLLNRLLTAFRYPGSNGDEELARLLQKLKKPRLTDEPAADAAE